MANTLYQQEPIIINWENPPEVFYAFYLFRAYFRCHLCAGDFTGGNCQPENGRLSTVVYGGDYRRQFLLVIALTSGSCSLVEYLGAFIVAGAFGTTGLLLLYYSMTKG